MRRLVAAFLTAALMTCAATGARAGSPQGSSSDPAVPSIPPNSQADVLLRAAIEQLVQALGQALHDVPRYALPEMNEHGDIILRRVDPPPEKAPVERGPTITLDEVAT